MNKIIKLSLVCIATLSTQAFADTIVQDAQLKAKQAQETAMNTADVESGYSSNSTVSAATKELTQSFNLGFSSTTGNEKTLNMNVLYKGDMIISGYAGKDLKVGFDASGYITKTGDANKIEEYSANFGLEQEIINDWFGYTSINWYRNEVLGYKNKFSIGAGAGKILFTSEVDSLRVKIGVAQNFADFADFSSVSSLDTENYATLNQYVEYNRKLNKVSNFYFKLGAQESFDNFSDIEGVAVLGLNFSVAEKVSVSIEEEVRYNGLGVVSDLLDSKSNTKTVVRVGYNF